MRDAQDGRIYTVLGKQKGQAGTFCDARKAFADKRNAQTAFTTAAKALKLE